MDTTSYEIASHIDRTRGELTSNIGELERKVKSVTDWEQQFQARPMALIGLAFGGGAILASLMGGRRYSRPRYSTNTPDAPNRGELMGKASDAWDGIKGALAGVAASRVTDYIEGVLPGFKEHFKPAPGQPFKAS